MLYKAEMWGRVYSMINENVTHSRGNTEGHDADKMSEDRVAQNVPEHASEERLRKLEQDLGEYTVADARSELDAARVVRGTREEFNACSGVFVSVYQSNQLPRAMKICAEVGFQVTDVYRHTLRCTRTREVTDSMLRYLQQQRQILSGVEPYEPGPVRIERN